MKDFKVSSDGWVTHDLVSEQLSRIPGVREGAEQQRQIFSLGEMLRDVRERFAKISQTEAARIVGIPQPELSRIETGLGSRGPTYATVIAILGGYERYLAPKGVDIGLTLDVEVQGGNSVHYTLAGAEFHED